MDCFGSGGTSGHLVIGAELLCTRCVDSQETSLFMTGNAENINNVLLGSRPAGHRWNTVKDVDIIPFSLCQKRNSFHSGQENCPCDDIMDTDELWVNLTL